MQKQKTLTIYSLNKLVTIILSISDSMVSDYRTCDREGDLVGGIRLVAQPLAAQMALGYWRLEMLIELCIANLLRNYCLPSLCRLSSAQLRIILTK